MIEGVINMKHKLIIVILLICFGIGIYVVSNIFFPASVEETEDAKNSSDTKEIITQNENSKDKEFSDYIIIYKICAKEIKKLEKKICLPEIQFLSAEKEAVEEKINETIYKAATDWMTYDFLKMDTDQLNSEITCHNGRYLSISLIYHLNSNRGNTLYNYIVIDLTTGKRVLLNDVIEDEERLASEIKEGKNVHAERAFLFTQKEAEDNLQRFLAEQTEEDILNVIKQCSMEEKKFQV